MHALVTGAAGLIGSNLTISLLEDGHTVVGLDSFTDNYDGGQKLRNIERATDWAGFELVRGDLAEMELRRLSLSCEIIFHLAAEPGVRASWGPASTITFVTTSWRRSAFSRA
jgi:UDP-glucuronate 4-epimerase